MTIRAFSLAELAELDLPEPAWLADGLVPAGSLVLLSGRPKSGKSLLTLDLAACVGMCESWLGRRVEHGGALVCSAEDDPGLVRYRLSVRLGGRTDPPLHVVPLDGSLDQSLRLDVAPSFAELAALVERLHPKLVVVDPLAEVHQLDENDAVAMSGLLRPLRQLSHQTGAAIVLVHHRNKAATDPGLAVRGSSAIVGGVDVVISVDAGTDDGDLEPGQTIRLHIQGRYAPKLRFAARLLADLRWEPTDATQANPSAAERAARLLEATGEALTVEELADRLGVAAHTLRNTLGTQVDAGRLIRTGGGTRNDPFRFRAPGVKRDETGNQSAGAEDVSSRSSTPYTPPTGRKQNTSTGATFWDASQGSRTKPGQNGGVPNARPPTGRESFGTNAGQNGGRFVGGIDVCFACGTVLPAGGGPCATCHPPPGATAAGEPEFDDAWP